MRLGEFGLLLFKHVACMVVPIELLHATFSWQPHSSAGMLEKLREGLRDDDDSDALVIMRTEVDRSSLCSPR